MDGNRHRQIHPHVQKPNIEPKIVKECSMCGDFGITTELFQCNTCLCRFQHTYCSRSFPNLVSEMLICNWCLHQNHYHNSKWKEASCVVEAEQGNDIKATKFPKCILEMAVQDSRVEINGEAKVGSAIVSLPSSSKKSGEMATMSSSKNHFRMEIIDDRRSGCQIPKSQRDFPLQFLQKKKKDASLLKCPPKITHEKMVPHLRSGKRPRYKLLSDVIS